MSKSHQVIVPAVALALSALVMARFACAAGAADVGVGLADGACCAESACGAAAIGAIHARAKAQRESSEKKRRKDMGFSLTKKRQTTIESGI